MEYRLKDYGVLKNGKRVTVQDEGDYPVYGANGKVGYANNALTTGETIVIGRVGANCGSVHYSKDPAWITDNTIGFQPSSDINGYYIYYLLKTLNLNRFSTGSAQPLLNQNTLNSFTLNLLSLSKQKKVGSFLYNLDEKISTNNRTIANIEELSQTLFKRWFIDFEFPDEDGNPYKSSGGRFITSELGEIPKGWGVNKLKKITKRIYAGGTPLRKEDAYWYPPEIPWLKTKEITDGAIIETEEKISEIGMKNSSAKWIEEGSIVIAMYGATAGRIGYLGKDMTSNQACCAIVSDFSTFLYNYLKFNQEYIKSLSTGSAQQNLNKSTIENLKIPFPSIKLIYKYEKLNKPLFRLSIELTRSNEKLKSLRNSLLPKLMSGELELPEELEV